MTEMDIRCPRSLTGYIRAGFRGGTTYTGTRNWEGCSLRSTWGFRAVASAGAAVLLLGACSSSKPRGSSSTTAVSGGSSSKLSGTPYELMWTETNQTSGPDYIPAIEAGVNSRGGIAGHPLKIVDCDDHGDANQATQCGQQAASDPNMLAVIGNTSTCGSNLLPLLAQAKMASIGDQFFCPEDFKSAQAFPFIAGTFVTVEGAALAVKALSLPNVAVTTLDLPAGREFPPLVNAVVGPAGGKVVATTYIPETATDMAPFASQIASHKQSILLEGNTTAIGIRLGKALAEQGYDQPIIYNGTTWDAGTLKANFGDTGTRYIVEGFNLGSAGYQQFNADMTKYAPGSTYRAADLITVWLASNLIARVAKTLPTISAASLFNYMSTTTSIDTFGLTPPLSYTVPSKALQGFIPRATNGDAALYKYENGTLVEVTPFEDVIP